MKTVLIAEDDPILSKRLERALAPHGDRFAWRMVTDGQAAIAVLEEEPIDLVVTDIQMPRMNGLVLLAYIHTYHTRMPCIVTSSYGTSRMRAKVPQEVLRFFPKPYNPDDLAQSILLALQRTDSPEMPDGLRLIAFLNMIEMEKISCGFRTSAPDCPDAILYFDNGILIHAQRGEMTGEVAFYEVMKGEIATYTFVDMPPEPPARNIHADLGELIRNVVADDPETELSLV